MDIYETIVKAIRDYMKEEDYKTLFLNGGCYWFATVVASWVPNSYLMINWNLEHCAVMVEQKLCDITGPISSIGYTYASERELKYMKKHYKIDRNLKPLEQYIRTQVEHLLQEKKLRWTEELNCNN